MSPVQIESQYKGSSPEDVTNLVKLVAEQTAEIIEEKRKREELIKSINTAPTTEGKM
jgi:hypothetical protein